MLGTSCVPVSGSQCVAMPGVCAERSASIVDRPIAGLGRRKAVISAAFISSTPRASARSAGLAASNLAFTWSQVEGSAAPRPVPAQGKAARQRRCRRRREELLHTQPLRRGLHGGHRKERAKNEKESERRIRRWAGAGSEWKPRQDPQPPERGGAGAAMRRKPKESSAKTGGGAWQPRERSSALRSAVMAAGAAIGFGWILRVCRSSVTEMSET